MFHLQCAGCGTSAYVDCVCPAEVTAQGVHLPHCEMTDPDAQVVCPPTSGCCTDDHSGDPDRRGHALLRCGVDHSDHPCPEPASCRLHASVKAHYQAMAQHFQQHDAQHGGPERHAFTLLEEPPEECPGGHHGQGVTGCPACRSLIITAVGTAATLRPVAS